MNTEHKSIEETEQYIKNILENNPNWHEVVEITNIDKYLLNSKNPEHSISNLLSELLGLELLGYGCCRAVFNINNSFAIKIPIDFTGCDQMEKDLEVWTEYPSSIKKYLAPVICHGELWTAFRYAAPISQDDYHLYEYKIMEIVKELNKLGIQCEDLCWDDEINYDQFGLIDGDLVIVDYGEFRLESETD